MASLAGVIEPEASLLDGAEVPAEVKPLAACAYEKAGAGAEAVADAFSVAEVILLIQKLKSFELEEIFEGSRAVADEIVYGFWRLSTRRPSPHHTLKSRQATRNRSDRDDLGNRGREVPCTTQMPPELVECLLKEVTAVNGSDASLRNRGSSRTERLQDFGLGDGPTNLTRRQRI